MSQFLILLVDDDTELLQIVSSAAEHSFPEASFLQITSASKAEEYINELDGKGPKLILLDINLKADPDGFAFLDFLAAHPVACSIPVVMLTVSELLDDIKHAYLSGANAFTTKPFSYEEWKEYLGNLRTYWFKTITLAPIRFRKDRPT
ncbi:response regulator [Spirosoma utsteinense]|uniref:CheY-like chemotaxis protein n=1 Tax=Spirosoma utsteinense TaxID=2585773 RepID=A0ABR6WGF2_9BACT|nr:response regulator [Spirosoma utsteinense]MBC3789152.1 CheY-like chemotaxis protein [Spirosoma utsteinense]MBC3795072.1 CheY-like chemotaxis protein [Spirosoma utsteinense]